MYDLILLISRAIYYCPHVCFMRPLNGLQKPSQLCIFHEPTWPDKMHSGNNSPKLSYEINHLAATLKISM